MCECLAADCEERQNTAPPPPLRPQSLPRLQLVRTQSLRLQLTPVQPTPPSVQCTLQHFHDLSCLPCLKKAPSGDLRHYYGDLREVLLSRPARDELVNDDRGPMVHTCEQRRVLHVELALLLCRRLSWWRMGSTR